MRLSVCWDGLFRWFQGAALLCRLVRARMELFIGIAVPLEVKEDLINHALSKDVEDPIPNRHRMGRRQHSVRKVEK